MAMAISNYNEEEEEESEEIESEEEEEEDEEEAVAVAMARKDAIYNAAALHEKLEDIRWPEDLSWIQTLSFTYADHSDDAAVDANDDLAREMAFYTQALEAAREAYTKLQGLGVPFLRPSDYYAEMVKSDKHMFKVKDKLLFQQKQMEEADERRKAREAKRFAKEVQTERVKERAKLKKQNIESVKKWRKMRKQSGFADGGEEFPADMDEASPQSKKRKVISAPWDRSGGWGHKPSRGPGRKERDMFSREDGNLSSQREQKGAFRGGRGGRSSFRGGRGGGGSFRGSRGGRSSVGVGRGGRSSKSRDYKDSKFGHGGKKSLEKKNNAESSADMGSYRGRFHKGQKRGKRS
ncbi:hypothetical protein O6H91_Y140900 [Diphasiastrum complanatum]|nr:hypothetical protein O6H91_Y140900 [Diphasiastrum complanatum]